ncbi:hypothetical protein [Prevotella pallens]
MEAIIFCISVIVIANVGGIYFYLPSQKREKKKKKMPPLQNKSIIFAQ